MRLFKNYFQCAITKINHSSTLPKEENEYFNATGSIIRHINQCTSTVILYERNTLILIDFAWYNLTNRYLSRCTAKPFDNHSNRCINTWTSNASTRRVANSAV